MLTRSLVALWFVALVLPGCGGDDTTATSADMTMLGADLAGAHLQSGMYTVSNIMKVSDGCGLMLEGAGNFTSTLVTNTGTMLSIGNACSPMTTAPMCSSSVYLEGSGTYTDATHATLTMSTTVTLPDMCTYMKMVTTMATFTGMNKLSVDFTDVESNYSATKCTSDMPPMTPPCTSHYTFDLAM